MNKYVENPSAWTAPVIPEKIPQGDMPGDKIEIGEDHINKANLIFRELLGQIRELKKEDADRKIVLTVCGDPEWENQRPLLCFLSILIRLA